VLRAIDAELPEYDFDIQTMEFTEILNGLATGRVLAGSQQFEWNKEREEKYLFATVPLIGYNTFVVTLDKPEYENVTGYADFAGKATWVTQGGSGEARVNSWNEEHPDAQIKAVILGSGSEERISGLNNGVIDFLTSTKQDFQFLKENFPGAEDWVLHENAKVYTSNSFILFGKEQTVLRDAFDEALKRVQASGKLSQLSIQFFGDDYTVKS
jgi:L-cystine transport system substrate-binding protein